MKINELRKHQKGSQKRHKHPLGTDDPSRYVGKFENYDEPQGVNSPAAKKQMTGEGFEGYTQRFAPDPYTPSAELMVPTEKAEIRKSRRAPMKQVRQNVKKMSGRLKPQITPVKESSGPIRAYHGTGVDFDKFSDDYAIGTLTWFTTDKDAILRREVGASTAGFLITAELDIKNPAGWNEYDRYGIDELIGKGYDGLALPDGDHITYVTFSDKQIRIVDKERVGKSVNESIRRPDMIPLNAEYEVTKRDQPVGKAIVEDGVIINLSVVEGADETYMGEIFNALIGSIIREADRFHSNLSIQVTNEEMPDLKTFLERFGFRHVRQNVMRRTAGAIRPPSVILTPGMNGRG